VVDELRKMSDDDVFEDYENGWARKSDFVGPDNVTINDCR
jgi:hypothetical protein